MLYNTDIDYKNINMEYFVYIKKLEDILKENNVSVCHGIHHAIEVMRHAENAIKEYDIDCITKDAVILAALLHDADDSKFFPNNKNNENLRTVLKDFSKEFVDLVERMVNLVSVSKNLDNIPEDVKDKEWMLIPRYADRLEALGFIGIERCYTYGKLVNTPLYVEDTPKAKSIEEIWSYSTIERFNSYKGKSKSMIDHYYDKLIRLANFPIRNKYLDNILKDKLSPMYDILLIHGSKGYITDDDVIEYLNNHK